MGNLLIVGLILVLSIGIIGRQIWKQVTGDSICAGCDLDCPVRDGMKDGNINSTDE